MNTSVSPPLAADTKSASSGVNHSVRPFYWSLRRELWENRSFYIAPAVVAALFLLAAVAGAFRPPEMLARFDTLSPDQQRAIVSIPYAAAAALLMLTSVIVGLFYCLDALYGERRDRSVLFWKSLPVSDWTSVLAKLAIPMLIAPLIVFVLVLATQLLMLMGHMVLWSALGLSVGNLLQLLPLIDMPLGAAHFLVTFSIWYAPVYAWLMLVSAWAQRSPVVWAIVPAILLVVFERMVLRTHYVSDWLRERLFGSFDAAFSERGAVGNAVQQLQQGGHASHAMRHGDEYTPDIMRFLSNPEVWIGVVVAAALIAATVWLRRRQESQST